MKMGIIQKTATLILAIGFAAGSALAGDMIVTIKQPFEAGGKNYPPGPYRILADDASNHINLLNLDRKTDDAIRFSTRLSSRDGHRGEVVFDETEGGLYLSEVYIIGMDGFFFQGAPGKHKHLVVKEDEP
jgi:hypothetical protein